MSTAILIGLAVFAALVALFLIIVALRPSDFRVSRTASIFAPPKAVFAQVNDFHKWQAWSPYDKRDPAMKRTYEGPREGTGASYAWNGNNEVGEGRTTIIESKTGELIRIKLEFVRPFAGTSTAEITFKPDGDRTAVTWSLTGKHAFVPKAVGLFINMDKMIGGDFETGLANLKSVVEAAPQDGPVQLTSR
jgi:Polyketide cyclase / dehydrase and lipid transport